MLNTIDVLVYKFYKAQVTGGGLVPEGDCQATLELDDKDNPTWSDLSDDFKEFALPWFSNTVRMGILHNPEPLKPFSEEALEHLRKHQLPSVGFVMVHISGKRKAAEVKVEPEKPVEEKKQPPVFYRDVGFTPPAHIFKKQD